MARDNNGVKSKVTHNYGQGSINRGNGQVGTTGDEGGLKPVGGNSSHNGSVGRDMESHSGPKGSSGTVKDNGGVGTIGGGGRVAEPGYNDQR